ncbi:MAG: hypothetical protein WHT63_05010, partial [Tepidiforma sp.]
MNSAPTMPANPDEEPEAPQRHLLRMAALAGWGIVLVVQVGQYLHRPTTANLIVAIGLATLFGLFLAHALFMRV